MARQEIKIHEKNIEQNEEIRDFYQRKFTNQELYFLDVRQNFRSLFPILQNRL